MTTSAESTISAHHHHVDPLMQLTLFMTFARFRADGSTLQPTLRSGPTAQVNSRSSIRRRRG
ncbi:hypothetical protein EJ03DRAFT_54432 [Teratosphaeria nubilosa]|uniref:Uncharacterized protein n=1 Tax=Teratosphaeria nubilosa TaxID=161662 RepID=A0A6G1KU26_9PEZI|nr:hypothetical protein EJ03DRAFT_54432 [Teratosphaeria nubilosa]